MKVKMKIFTVMFFSAVIITVNSGIAFAQSALSIDVNQAVQMALKSNNNYQSSQLEIDKAWETRKDAVDQVKFYTDDRFASSSAIGNLQSFYMNDTAWQAARHSSDLTEDQIKNAVVAAYWTVKQNECQVQKSKNQEISDEKAVQDANVMQEVGMITNLDASSAETALIKTRKDIENAQKSLADSEQKLRYLLNVSDYTTLALTSEPEIKDISSLDLNQLLSKSLEYYPGIKLANDQYNLAKEQKNFSKTYEAGSITENQKELSYEQSKLDLQTQVKSLYYNIIQLNNKNDQLESANKILRQRVNDSKIKKEAGVSTSKQLLADQTTLKNNLLDQEVLKCNFEQYLNNLNVLCGNTN